MREHVALAPQTTLGVGGSARFFFEATTEDDVTTALAWARAHRVPVFVLGGGSNVLVADRGLDALVLRVRLTGVDEEDRGSGVVRLRVAAGEAWDGFVRHAAKADLAGIECLAGIPGDVGATPIQNVGAYGQEVAETIAGVRVVERATGEARDLSPEECAFGYRDSVFKRAHKDRFVVVAVSFDLRRGGAPSLGYPELERAIRAGASPSPSLEDVGRVVRDLRRAKSMLLDPDGENGKSAGSFFMNPTLSPAAATAVEARVAEFAALAPSERMPRYAAPNGVKLSAAWLIERAGFTKGSGEGRVGISTRHSLAIVNRGGATSAAIVDFARTVQRGVQHRFGVRLTPEPVFAGFEPTEIADLVGEALS